MQNEGTIVYLGAENKEKVVTEVQEVKVLSIPSYGNALFLNGSLKATEKTGYS